MSIIKLLNELSLRDWIELVNNFLESSRKFKTNSIVVFIDCSKSSIGKPPISVKVRITIMVVINIIHFTVEIAVCLRVVNV